MNRGAVARARNGFGLIEIVVALTIMMVVLTSLAKGTAGVARMSNGSADRVQRSAAIDDFSGTLSAMPWDQLPTGTSCETISGEFPYERCVTVTDVSLKEKQLLITVTPTNPRIAPDTVIIDRGRPLGSDPFPPS